MTSGSQKELRAIRREVEARGWTVVLTNGGHMRWTHPSGRFFFSSQTPSDYRVVKKIWKDIERAEKGIDPTGR